MEPTTLTSIVEQAALVSTITFFLSGTLTCRRIILAKSVLDVNYLPYIVTAVSCSLWVLYGIIAADRTLCIVNGTGAFLQALYLVVYLKHVEDGKLMAACVKRICAGILLVMSVMLIVRVTFREDGGTRQYLGILCDCVTICMFASPLSTLSEVIQTKKTSTMSFPLSVMTVIVSVLWVIYGIMKHDYYIQLPNFLGGLLGIVQLGLFFLYPTGHASTKQGFAV